MADDDFYLDENGLHHFREGTGFVLWWEALNTKYMDACHAAGLDPISSANAMINSAAYIVGGVGCFDAETRAATTEQLVAVFRAKVEAIAKRAVAARSPALHVVQNPAREGEDA